MYYREFKDWRGAAELTKLKDLSNPPKQIFYSGQWDGTIFVSCVAIIGSRRMTDYGRRVIEKLIPQLVVAKRTVVSGFMYGVDQYAQQICAESGGKTIAVLGWGMSHELTGFDLKLAQKIIATGGLLISEWEKQKPALWTFPARNRIVAAMSTEVIIIEAGVNSGSFITARIAGKLKRKLWAVPGPITSATSRGTNLLISQGKAKMWLGQETLQIRLGKKSDPLLDLLENESLSTDEAARKLNESVSTVGAQLSLLTISGQVVERGGKYYLNDAG